jgi:hypothetical protein
LTAVGTPVLRVDGVIGEKRKFGESRSLSLFPYAVLVIGILLLGVAGFMYFGVATGERTLDKNTSSGLGTPGIFTDSGIRFEFDGLETYYHRNREAGSIFVLKGRVIEAGGGDRKGRIRVNASVLNPDKGFIAKKTVYAGNIIPDEDLLNRDRAFIEQALSGNGGGGAPVNTRTSPPVALPFMVVFFDVPNNVTDYELSADQVN